MAVLTPADLELTAIDNDLRLPVGQPPAVGVDKGRARAGTAGQGKSGPTLPNPKADRVCIQNLGEADIGALGKDRIMLQPRSDLADRNSREVGNEDGRMRV